MADGLHMNPDLMGATRGEAALEQCHIVKLPPDAVMGDRRFAATTDCHSRTHPGVTPDRFFDGTRAHTAERPKHKRKVIPPHAASLQLAHQISLRFEGSRHNQQTARLLVQAMHYTGSRNAG